MVRAVLLAALVVAGCAPSLGDLKPALGTADRGTIWFRAAEGLVISGDLAFPSAPAAARVPAVVLMHGCSGLPHRAINGWRPVLDAWGFATFVVDSFSARGYREVCTRALALRPDHRVPDAYGALRILATHPRIDRTRIVLMGFSHGGIVTLGAATTWAAERYGEPGGPRFRAFVPFYPYCNATVPELSAIAAPLRIHIGAFDDWTPAATCVALARRLQAAGLDAEITVYPEAHHAFDAVGSSIVFAPTVDNAAGCTPRLGRLDGPILNEAEFRACVKKGATSGWNPEATEAARRNVRAELDALLR